MLPDYTLTRFECSCYLPFLEEQDRFAPFGVQIEQFLSFSLDADITGSKAAEQAAAATVDVCTLINRSPSGH